MSRKNLYKRDLARNKSKLQQTNKNH